MLLESSFSKNPTLPSLRYAVDTLQPIVLPWTKRYIRVGTGFSSKAMQNGNPFLKNYAFQELPSRRLHYRKDGGGSFTQSETSSGSHYQDHMQVSVAAKAGISVVEVSGQARYETSVLKNKDVRMRVRLHSNHKADMIRM
jgi:hypothetical protein